MNKDAGEEVEQEKPSDPAWLTWVLTLLVLVFVGFFAFLIMNGLFDSFYGLEIRFNPEFW